jgi:hypothetical protein
MLPISHHSIVYDEDSLFPNYEPGSGHSLAFDLCTVHAVYCLLELGLHRYLEY